MIRRYLACASGDGELPAGFRPCDTPITLARFRDLCVKVKNAGGPPLMVWPTKAVARDVELWIEFTRFPHAPELPTFLANRTGARRCRWCGCTMDNRCRENLLETRCEWAGENLCTHCL